MVRGGWSRAWARWRRWAFPAAGLATALGLALVPALPFGMGRWPLGGPFGAFTWAAWVVSTALAITLILLGATLLLRRRGAGAATPVPAGRLARAAAGFTLLAVAAFGTASRADLIERNPVAALVLALAVLVTLRGLVRAAVAGLESGTGDTPPADVRPAPPAPRSAPKPAARKPDPRPEPALELDPEDDPDAVTPRWVRVVATGMAVVLLLFVGASLAVRWLGPGLGLVLTVPRATPIFWGEATFYEYDAVKKAGGDASVFLAEPAPGTTAAARRGVLPAGAKLAVKGWLDGGAEVRVEHDPGGKFEGEWGYVRLGDVAE